MSVSSDKKHRCRIFARSGTDETLRLGCKYAFISKSFSSLFFLHSFQFKTVHGVELHQIMQAAYATILLPSLPACCKFPRIIVSMKGSNSERQFQQQYNNTGTPPLRAPIFPSVAPLCPSDTSGVSLQSLRPRSHIFTHTHTQAL